MLRKLIAALVTLILVSVALLLWIGYRLEPAPDTLEFEVFKAVLQLGVASVIGLGVSLLTFEYQRERQQIDMERDLERQRLDKERDRVRQQLDKERDLERQKLDYREDLLKITLNRAMVSYSAVKKARRLLRARAVVRSTSAGYLVLVSPYDSYMDAINDAQLEFENLLRDVKTSSKAFTEADALETALRDIDSYLGKVVGEYERNRRSFQGDPPTIELASLPRLRDFLARAKKGDSKNKFQVKVVHSYHNVQGLIRRDLLHSRLPG